MICLEHLCHHRTNLNIRIKNKDAIAPTGPCWFCCVRSVERYDPSKDAWEMVAPMADKRINFGVGVMLGFIFVVGGHNGVSHLSSIERYDPHQNQWTTCRPMNEPRTGEFTSCSVDNKTQMYDTTVALFF